MSSLHAVPTRHRRVSLIKCKTSTAITIFGPAAESSSPPPAVSLAGGWYRRASYTACRQFRIPRPHESKACQGRHDVHGPVGPIVGVVADESGYETRQSSWETNNEIRPTLSSRERQTCRALGPNRSTISFRHLLIAFGDQSRTGGVALTGDGGADRPNRVRCDRDLRPW